MTGNINNVNSMESLKNTDELINEIRNNEEHIINLGKLEYIEQYIAEHI